MARAARDQLDLVLEVCSKVREETRHRLRLRGKTLKGDYWLMGRRTIVALIVCLLPGVLIPGTGASSDWTGVYARIDKVVFEPSESAPERIQIWGAFAIASKQDRNSYDRAERGYLYYSLKPGKEAVCRKEWADLKAVAGTDEIVSFGSRSEPTRLRKAADKPGDPDVYPVASGITKMSGRNSDYGPIRELKSLPKERQ